MNQGMAAAGGMGAMPNMGGMGNMMDQIPEGFRDQAAAGMA